MDATMEKLIMEEETQRKLYKKTIRKCDLKIFCFRLFSILFVLWLVFLAITPVLYRFWPDFAQFVYKLSPKIAEFFQKFVGTV